MKMDCSIEIDASAAEVWAVFADVERWPEWTASVKDLRALDGRELAVGRRFAIKQPRLPKLVWVVSAVEPGASWSWESRTPGNTTIATHEVIALGEDRTLVKQRIEQRGPGGVLVGVLMRGMTKRYLALEAHGLKTRTESLRRRDAASA